MTVKLGFTTSVFEGARALLQSDHVGMDLIMCMLGPLIANGTYRAVYQHALDPSMVIKIEYGHERKDVHDAIMDNTFCNVQEFLIWKEVESHTGKLAWVKDCFAPVEWISPSGHVLCMRKTTEQPKRKRPDMIYDFLVDVKSANFGWIGNNFVCHDYAHVQAFTTFSKKMRKVKDIWD